MQRPWILLNKQQLKGTCHEDFAILGQFCAKTINSCLLLLPKMFLAQFLQVNPFPSLPLVATDDRKHGFSAVR